MITVKQTKKKFKINLLIFFIFLIYFIIGVNIYKDYGISFDENINRDNGFVSLKYIFEKIGINADLSKFVVDIPNLSDYKDKAYGVVFDLPLAFFEFFFDIDNTRDAFLFRHLINFILFFISTVVFFILCNLIFQDKVLSLIGSLTLILSPRIFAESFYNPKDIIFMSLFIIATLFSVKFLRDKNNSSMLFAVFFSSLAVGVRIVGIYLPLITLFFFLFNTDNTNNKFKIFSSIKYLFLFLGFLVFLWPFLWEDTFLNLLVAFNEFKNYPWKGEILYFGKFINAEFTPWHYFFVWFLLTTPIIFSVIIILGVIYTFFIFFRNLFQIEVIKNNNLWRENYEMFGIFFLMVTITPILSVILFNSTLYSGWRQLYFLYPPLIILGLFFLNFLKKINIKYFKIFILIFSIQSLFSIYNIIKMHPHQHVYFNGLANSFIKGKFALDYWGVSNSQTLNHLLKNTNNDEFPIKISSASFTDLNKTKLIMEAADANKINFIEDRHYESDFIFTNYYYFTRPIYNKKRYIIPDYFKSYYKFEINGNIVNELFINMKNSKIK